MAAKTFVDAIAIASLNELDEMQKLLDERRLALRKEQAKAIIKKVFLGSYLTYQVGLEKRVGLVQVITEDYVGVKNESSVSGKIKRLGFEEILEISEEPIFLEQKK